MDTAHCPHEEEGINGLVKVLPMETNSSLSSAPPPNNKANNNNNAPPRPQKPQALNCPRCNSAHTKFCYYNNYSLSQPRYFCKTCRRYWTEGGSLRNVPVGGGSRKNKRSSFSKIKLPFENNYINNSQNPNQDLNLAYSQSGLGMNYNNGIPPQFLEFPSSTSATAAAAATTTTSHHFSELLKAGNIGGSKGFSSFMSMIPPVSDNNNTNGVVLMSSTTSGSSSRLPFQDFSGKPSGINFNLYQQHQGFESGSGGGVEYGSLHQENNNSNNNNNNSSRSSSDAKLFFAFEDLKQPLNFSTTTTHQLVDQQSGGNTHGDHHQSSGYWNGASW